MNIALIWATWAVGQEILKVMHVKNIQPTTLLCIWSPRSVWKNIETPYGLKTIEPLTEDLFENIDIALRSAWWSVSRKRIPRVAAQWVISIDNSSAWRYDDTVPLVIPSINGDIIWSHRIIANPNCTTAIAAMALWPIYKHYGLQKVIVSTYQATSGAGQQGIEELFASTKQYMKIQNSRDNSLPCHTNNISSYHTPNVFQHPIAFNLIPHIDDFQDNGYTKEEMKVTRETQKIFADPTIAISCTAVRIPTERSHAEAITLETKKAIDLEHIRQLLIEKPWVDLVDNIANNSYPMPLTSSSKSNIEVGRLRKNPVFWNYGLDLFVSGDQLLRWAALNAVEILEKIAIT